MQHLTPTAPCSMLTSIFFTIFFLLMQSTLPNRRVAHSLPKNSMHILPTVVYTFLMVLTRRICTMINSFIILTTLVFNFIMILLRKIRSILSRVNLFGYIDIFTSFIVFFSSSKQFFHALTLWGGKTKGHQKWQNYHHA